MRRLFLLTFGLCAFLLATNAQAIILEGGQLTQIQGEVFLSVKDTSVPVPENIESSLPVPEGSSIRTKEGTAKVSYAGGNVFELKPNSYCSISKDGLVIVKGSVQFEVRSADAEALSVVTPEKVSRIAGDGGLAGMIEVDAEGKELITLSEGAVAESSPIDEGSKGALDRLASKASGTIGEGEISETELLSYILIQAGAVGESKPASPFRPY